MIGGTWEWRNSGEGTGVRAVATPRSRTDAGRHAAEQRDALDPRQVLERRPRQEASQRSRAAQLHDDAEAGLEHDRINPNK